MCYFLIVVKPGAIVGPLRKGGRVTMLPSKYSGLDRFSLPIAGQIQKDRFTGRFLIPISGIGLELLPTYEEALVALNLLPEGGTTSAEGTTLVPFDECRGKEVYRRDNVEIISVRSAELAAEYDSTGSSPPVDFVWVGYDVYSIGEWSLIAAALSSAKADVLLSHPEFRPDLGLFTTKEAAEEFSGTYADWAKEWLVEPSAIIDDPNSSLHTVVVEIAIRGRSNLGTD